ncbi:MAG TPA: cardiolipin synthase ClsB [Burkholderiaceae bacterium]|nr:cardiolipin synthase ClsB [Burkholderiaceae bacterium]
MPGTTAMSSWNRASRPVFSGGNRIQLLRGGDEFFPALLAEIERAQREVMIETYIFNRDPSGLRIANALIAAASRGVRVHVTVDGFGSGGNIHALAQRFEGTGVIFDVYRRVRHWSDVFRRGSWRRLHRKLAQVDARVAFVGGVNIIDDRFDLHHGWSERPRLDFALRIEGPLVDAVTATMHVLRERLQWRREFIADLRGAGEGGAGDAVDRVREMVKRMREHSPMQSRAARENRSPIRAAFVVRDNVGQRRTIERAYVEAVVRARQRVTIVNPYFYPGRIFKRVLKRAAARGVRVTLVMQGKPDYRLAAWAAQALYDELLAAGIHIVEYAPAFLHAKVAVVDDGWATVGSSNIDPLSLLVNREANVIVLDTDFNAELTREIDAAVAVSRPVTREKRRRGFAVWMIKRVVGTAARLFMAITGARERF